MVNLITFKCPQCNADLQIEEGRHECFCSYCGTKIYVHDDSVKTVNINIKSEQNINSTHREINEADVIRAKTEQMVKAEKIKKESRYNKIKSFFLKLTIILWLAFIVLYWAKDNLFMLLYPHIGYTFSIIAEGLTFLDAILAVASTAILGLLWIFL